MENKNSNIGLFLPGVCLAAGLIASAFLASNTVEKVKFASDTIQVKGVAERTVRADRASRQGGQITRPDSVDVSGYGIYDTRSTEKKITAVVTVEHTLSE